ncbi:MAG: hypothetical protein O7D35_06780 [Acidobacteria bacterium]|nr:hypothetical protein [Acidobacteriota bacterium]
MRDIYRILRTGLPVAFGSVRLVWLLLSVNLAFAVLALLPALTALDRLLAPVGSWEGLLQTWPAWFDADFQTHAAPSLQIFSHQVALVIFLDTLVSAFLTAGCLGVLHDADGSFSLGAFFRGCGHYGFAFLRLLAVFLAASWLVVWLAGAQLGAVVGSLAFDWPSQRGATLLHAGQELVVVVLFYLLTWAAELSRVRLVVEKRRSALGSFLAGLSLLVRRFPRVLGIFGTLAALQVLFLGGSAWLLNSIPATSTLGLCLLVVYGQLVIGVRLAFRLAGLECGRRWFLETH